MKDYTFPNTRVEPKKPLPFDDSEFAVTGWTKAKELVEDVLHVVFKPVRLVVLAYSYVLSGQKVERPYQWSEI